MKERTCFITNVSAPAREMIRFVAGPDGCVAPDLRGNLPGRGAWLSMSREIVEKAIKNRAFSHALKREVQVSTDLADTIDRLLVRAALGSLSIARKSGSVVAGISKVDTSLRSGKACMILHAREAAEDGKRKIAQAIRAVENKKQKAISVLTVFTTDEMSCVFSGNSVMHAVVYKGSVTDGFIKRVWQLVAYRKKMKLKDIR